LQVPAEARKAELGVRWLLLEPGSGEPPDLDWQISATATAWKSDGSPGSTPAGPQPLTFSIYALPEPLREPMRALRQNAKVRYWLPAASLHKWKPPSWEAADLVVDVQVMAIAAPKRVERSMDGKVPPGLEPKPEPLPPDEAKQSKLGHRHLRLLAGNGGVQPRKDAKVELRFSAWRVAGVVVTPIALDQQAKINLADTPPAIAEVVSGMVQGDVTRVWLPASAVKNFVTAEGGDKVIVDLGLAGIY
jgi:hypothetical protein